MPKLTIVDNINEIPTAGWIDCPKFLSKDKIVTHNHKIYADQSYYGEKFQIVSKKHKLYSISERICNVALGLFLTFMTLGIYLIKKEVRDLFTSNVKTKARYALKIAPNTFIKDKKALTFQNLEQSKNTLSNGVNLPPNLTQTISDLFHQIINKDAIDGVTYFKSQDTHRVFTHILAPDFIFKLDAIPNPQGGTTKERFQKVLEAETIKRVYNLYKLKIPKQKLISLRSAHGQSFDIIAEEKINYPKFQRRQFSNPSNDTALAISHLAQFICRTGYSDTEYRNNPMTHDGKIALIDLEHFESAPVGLFGHDVLERTGLIKCVHSKHHIFVEYQAARFGIFGNHHLYPLKNFGYTQVSNKNYFNTQMQEKILLDQEIKDIENLHTLKSISANSTLPNFTLTKEQQQQLLQHVNLFEKPREQNLREFIIDILTDYNNKLATIDPEEDPITSRKKHLTYPDGLMQKGPVVNVFLNILKEQGFLHSFEEIEPLSFIIQF